MQSYSPSYQYYPSTPSMPCTYSNFSPSPTSYCSCCCSPTPYYQQPFSSTFLFSPPTSPYITHTAQVSTPSVNPQPISTQSTTPKITRLQYSNRDRYILNELFKRTPYPNAIQRDVIARQLGITQEQIRIWFQNRRRLQTQRDTGERVATTSEMIALQQGRANVNGNELKNLLNDVIKYKDAPPRLRLDESS